MMPVRPKLIDFLTTDFVSLLFTLLVPVCLGLALWACLGLPVLSGQRILEDLPFERLTPTHAAFFASFAAVGLVVATVLVWFRISAARRAFAGVYAPGQITKITKFKDRAYVHYRYTHNDHVINTWRFVHQTAAVKKLCEDQAVQVALEPTRPQSSWVVEMFD